jgi:hypothetical protein
VKRQLTGLMPLLDRKNPGRHEYATELAHPAALNNGIEFLAAGSSASMTGCIGVYPPIRTGGNHHAV